MLVKLNWYGKAVQIIHTVSYEQAVCKLTLYTK